MTRKTSATREMPTFAWTGHSAQGPQVTGRIQAENAELARAQLRRQGLHVKRLQRLWWNAPQSIRPRELAQMTRQLAALIRAGVPLVPALQMVSRSATTQALKELMNAVCTDVESGMPLHTALAAHPQHFSGLYTSMVSAGEAAGILDTMMERLAATLEKNEALRSRVRSALMYPCAVIMVALAVLALIMVYVVPVFEDVFKAFGSDLPWPTQAVLALSQALSQSGWVWLSAVLLLPWWWQRLRRHAAWQRRLDRWLLGLPLVGRLLRCAVVARWTQTLSALLAAGVPLTEALGPAGQACDHAVYARLTEHLQRRVSQGGSLSEAMAHTGRFPDMIVQLCATGEETSALESLLERAGVLMETELDDQVNGLSSLLEPLIIVVLGGLIGGILVAMYLPIFRLGQVF
jgi:type IV pilus assembly protein PilC